MNFSAAVNKSLKVLEESRKEAQCGSVSSTGHWNAPDGHLLWLAGTSSQHKPTMYQPILIIKRFSANNILTGSLRGLFCKGEHYRVLWYVFTRGRIKTSKLIFTGCFQNWGMKMSMVSTHNPHFLSSSNCSAFLQFIIEYKNIKRTSFSSSQQASSLNRA